MLIVFDQTNTPTKELLARLKRQKLNSASYGKILSTLSVDTARTFIIQCADSSEDKNYRHAVLFIEDPQSQCKLLRKKLQRICAAKGIEFIDDASLSKRSN